MADSSSSQQSFEADGAPSAPTSTHHAQQERDVPATSADGASSPSNEARTVISECQQGLPAPRSFQTEDPELEASAEQDQTPQRQDPHFLAWSQAAPSSNGSASDAAAESRGGAGVGPSGVIDPRAAPSTAPELSSSAEDLSTPMPAGSGAEELSEEEMQAKVTPPPPPPSLHRLFCSPHRGASNMDRGLSLQKLPGESPMPVVLEMQACL